MTLRPQHTYVLRVWLEAGADRASWRASISDISGADQPERRYFNDVEAMIAFLKDQLEALQAEGGFGGTLSVNELDG